MKCPHCGKEIGQWVAKEIGTIGGKTTLERHGSNHFKEMQRKAVEARKRNQKLVGK